MAARTHLRRLGRCVALLAALLLAAACTVRTVAGRPPAISALDRDLAIGRSTEADVSRILGAPFGQGRAMFPFHDAPRDTWTYYFELGDENDDRRTFLWVFFDDGNYDGYVWFSSLPPL